MKRIEIQTIPMYI